MELLHPFKKRQQRKVEERVHDVASHLSSEMITYLASQCVGDLPVFVGKVPSKIKVEDFVSRVETETYRAIEQRTPSFAGQLAVNVERSRLASTENVRVGNHGWRNEIKPEGLTIVVTPTEQFEPLLSYAS